MRKPTRPYNLKTSGQTPGQTWLTARFTQPLQATTAINGYRANTGPLAGKALDAYSQGLGLLKVRTTHVLPVLYCMHCTACTVLPALCFGALVLHMYRSHLGFVPPGRGAFSRRPPPRHTNTDPFATNASPVPTHLFFTKLACVSHPLTLIMQACVTLLRTAVAAAPTITGDGSNLRAVRERPAL